MLVPPLNDTKCLSLLFTDVQRLKQQQSVRALAAQFASVNDLIWWIRSLEQRDDLGDLNDGPRLPCEVSQRLRWAPSDPNCFERLAMFLALAELIDPATTRTAASMILDNGWHSFPVEIRNDLPEIVVLDPIAPPRNTMAATAYRGAKTSLRTHVAPWFHEVARNACMDADAEDLYERAVTTLRNAIATGEPLDDPEALDYVMSLAAQDADLWGAAGHAAYDRVERSLRNLMLRLDRDEVRKFVDDLIERGQTHAPAAIKAALIAKYGPAAAIALEGVDAAVEERPGSSQRAQESARTSEAASGDAATEANKPPGSRPRFPYLHRLRKMSLAFR